jgi:hypothetical protein
MIRRDWTEEEDNIIRDIAAKASIQRIAVKVRRPNTFGDRACKASEHQAQEGSEAGLSGTYCLAVFNDPVSQSKPIRSFG